MISSRIVLSVLVLGLLSATFLSKGLVADEKQPVPAAQKTPEKGGEWKSLFDGKTMSGWVKSEYGVAADVGVEDGAIVIELADGCNGITYKKDFPKINYEIRLEGRRVLGTDFWCGLTFPVNDDPLTLILGGWGGSLVGISSLDGKDAARNESKTYLKFDQEKWYSVRLRVTADKIQTWVDDKLVIDQSIVGKKLSIRPEVAPSKPLGIATWNTTGAIRKIEYRTIAAEGKK